MTIKCATDSGAARSIPAAMASAFDPNNAIRYNNRADAYFELGQYQRAIQDLDKAIQLDSGDAAAYLMRSLAHNASPARSWTALRTVELDQATIRISGI